MDFITNQAVQSIETIRSAGSLEELASSMETILQGLGIKYFSLGELGVDAEPGDGVLTNFPFEWTDRYVAGRYEFNDPVHTKLIRTRAPFTWDSLLSEGYLGGKASKIFYEGGEAGYKQAARFRY